ncbi:uncharacterized protein [Ciconia boyciana]|uniref:uncharacterized protein n=1 Tax=Ciconia boyciana TaxID=52775 RepID=UPI003BA1C0EF
MRGGGSRLPRPRWRQARGSPQRGARPPAPAPAAASAASFERGAAGRVLCGEEGVGRAGPAARRLGRPPAERCPRRVPSRLASSRRGPWGALPAPAPAAPPERVCGAAPVPARRRRAALRRRAAPARYLQRRPPPPLRPGSRRAEAAAAASSPGRRSDSVSAPSAPLHARARRPPSGAAGRRAAAEPPARGAGPGLGREGASLRCLSGRRVGTRRFPRAAAAAGAPAAPGAVLQNMCVLSIWKCPRRVQELPANAVVGVAGTRPTPACNWDTAGKAAQVLRSAHGSHSCDRCCLWCLQPEVC